MNKSRDLSTYSSAINGSINEVDESESFIKVPNDSNILMEYEEN